MMCRLVSLPLALIIAVPVAFASDTKVKTTYRDPSAGTVAFKRIVVALVNGDADLRRRAEDGLARRIKNAVAARTIVPDAELRDRDAVRARLASGAVDGVIVVRLLGVDRDVTVSAGQVSTMPVPSLWDTWGGSWALVETPGYAAMTTVVSGEIHLYAVETGKLVWSGTLTSTDPKSLRVLLDELVEAGSTELKKQRLI
jgi:hypothetical protein